MSTRSTGVYEIVNVADGKRYIGSAVDFENRWAVHRHGLARGNHHSQYLQAAWNKYGAESFKFQKLIVCDRANLVMYEQAAIDALDPEYNICRSAQSTVGIRWTEAAKARVAATRPNDHFKGRKHSAETLARMSAAKRGNTATKGKKRQAEAVEKTADAHRGRKRTELTRARIAAAQRAAWVRKKAQP